MNPEENQFRHLMSQMLDGDFSSAVGEGLVRLCETDPGRVRRLREELELAELIRQTVLGDEAMRSFADQLAFRLGDGIAGADESDWIQRLLDGELDEAGLDEVVRLCWRDSAFAARLRRELAQDDLLHQTLSPARSCDAFLEGLETRMWAEQAGDHFVDEVASKIISLTTESAKTISIPLHPELEPDRPKRDLKRSIHSILALTGGWAAAAGAAILLGLSIAYQPAPGVPTESVAEVTRSLDGVRWAVDGSPVEDRYFAPGLYELESGVVTLTFAGGAEMTVEGPAEFEVRGEREAFVHSGVAVLAKNDAGPEGGFRLRTDALDLGESGNMIGLVADGFASSEAVVFDGDAEICLPRLGFCRDLFALEAVRADLGREKLFDIPFNPNVFARAWQANAGIEGNTGSLRVTMPGERARTSKDGKEVRLSVEKIRFLGKGEIEVDTLEPGQFASVSKGSGTKLDSSGRELRSYLLQWDSASGKLTKDGESLEASVTFDHEIVGVIYSPDRLAGSDDLVGTSVDMAAARGLEMDNGSATGDQILLSDDRRTVNLKLSGDGPDRLDHVRVLVALN